MTAIEQRKERHFWVRAATLVALGLIIVTLLGAAFLSISHAPKPHHVPLGYVGADATREALVTPPILAAGSRQAARVNESASHTTGLTCDLDEDAALQGGCGLVHLRRKPHLG